MKWILFSLMITPSFSLANSPYSCSTEFGENVPIRKIVLKADESCPNCGEVKTEVPAKQIDTSLSKDWNLPVLKSTAKDAGTLKRYSFKVGKHAVYIDTRYMKQKGPRFEFDMTCDKKENCKGTFRKAKDGKIVLKPDGALFDQRIPNNQVEMSVDFTTRERLGLLVRLSKQKVPLKDGTFTTISGSGEFKFFSEDERYVHDTGVDEQLVVHDDETMRLAAIEVKIRCSIKDE